MLIDYRLGHDEITVIVSGAAQEVCDAACTAPVTCSVIRNSNTSTATTNDWHLLRVPEQEYPRSAASHEEAHLHSCVTDKVYKALVVDVCTSPIL